MSSEPEIARRLGLGEYRQGGEFGPKKEEEVDEMKQIEEELIALKGFTCEVCGFKTTHKVALVGHMMSHKKKENSGS